MTNKCKENSFIAFILFIVTLFFPNGCVDKARNTIPETVLSGTVPAEYLHFFYINGMEIPLDKEGNFRYSVTAGYPQLLEIEYDMQDWVVYIEPGEKEDMIIHGNGEVSYSGSQKAVNAFLMKVTALDEEVNEFFSREWVNLHAGGQDQFIQVIDSLKNKYLDYLEKEGDGLSPRFRDLFEAEVAYSLGRLVSRFPEIKRDITGVKPDRTAASKQFLAALGTEQPQYLGSPGYVEYQGMLLDQGIDELTAGGGNRHSALKRMDVLPQSLQDTFASQEIRDFFHFRKLKDHMTQNGIQNSGPYVQAFREQVQNPSLLDKLNAFAGEWQDSRKGREIHAYKTEGGIILEAHFFRPETGGEHQKPAMAIFHGGGWVAGSPRWAFDEARHYAELGMVGIAVQYRLANFRDVLPTDCMADARDFFLWLRRKAGSLGVDPGKVAAEGWSAGGQLILSAAILPQREEGGISSAPDTLVLKSPVISTDDWFQTLLLNSGKEAEAFSPLHQLKEGLPLSPVIILQGETDRLTPTKYAQEFQEKMKQLGYSCELVLFPDHGHLFTPVYLNDVMHVKGNPEVAAQAQKEADVFLDKMGFAQASGPSSGPAGADSLGKAAWDPSSLRSSE